MGDDLADLGLRFHTEGGDQAVRVLDQVAEKSGKAEKATDSLATSQRRSTGATAQMMAAIEQAVMAIRDNTSAVAALTRQQEAMAAAAVKIEAVQRRVRKAHEDAASGAKERSCRATS
jgi:hypothetical protein